MRSSVFIAHPVTGTGNPEAAADTARDLRTALIGLGCAVRPEVIVDREVATSRIRAGAGRLLATGNVEQVASATMLVILADGAAETSSVWIEAGVALARGVPTVVVASPGTALPFLLTSALGVDAGSLPACHRITADLRRSDIRSVAREILALAQPGSAA